MDATRRTERPPGHALLAEQAAALWLTRRDGEAWSESDQSALDAWLAQDSAHRVAFLRLQTAWQESGRLQALGAGWQGSGPPPRGYWQAPLASRSEQVLQAMAQRQSRQPVASPPRLVPRLAAVAALVLCALGAGWGWRVYTHVDSASYRTALGAVQTQSLMDGSQAVLASNSQIAVHLSRRERRIELHQGEAIFDVAKDRQRPFVVDAGRRQVVAVGTRFSVRRDGRDLRVVVTEGTVRLEAPPGTGIAQPAATLPAGSVALVRDDGVLVRSLAVADAERLLDWRDGLLVFRDATLAEASAEFNRYNARKLLIGDAQAGALRIGGSFRWDNAEGFVRLLEAGFPVSAETHPDHVVLHSR